MGSGGSKCLMLIPLDVHIVRHAKGVCDNGFPGGDKVIAWRAYGVSSPFWMMVSGRSRNYHTLKELGAAYKLLLTSILSTAGAKDDQGDRGDARHAPCHHVQEHRGEHGPPEKRQGWARRRPPDRHGGGPHQFCTWQSDICVPHQVNGGIRYSCMPHEDIRCAE
jgi:hypothetical protein